MVDLPTNSFRVGSSRFHFSATLLTDKSYKNHLSLAAKTACDLISILDKTLQETLQKTPPEEISPPSACKSQKTEPEKTELTLTLDPAATRLLSAANQLASRCAFMKGLAEQDRSQVEWERELCDYGAAMVRHHYALVRREKVEVETLPMNAIIAGVTPYYGQSRTNKKT